MMRRIQLFLFLVLLSSGMNAQVDKFTAVKDPSAIKLRITEANDNIHSLSCDFTQLKQLSFLEEEVKSSGKFYFEKESKIRWEYDQPYSYIIIMNGNLIKIQDDDNTNTLDASSNRLFSSINSVMAGIIDGSVINREDQFKSSVSENESSLRIALVPVIPGMKDFITSIEIELNKKDYTVDSLKIIEKNGDYTLIRFKNKSLNASIPENLFGTN